MVQVALEIDFFCNKEIQLPHRKLTFGMHTELIRIRLNNGAKYVGLYGQFGQFSTDFPSPVFWMIHPRILSLFCFIFSYVRNSMNLKFTNSQTYSLTHSLTLHQLYYYNYIILLPIWFHMVPYSPVWSCTVQYDPVRTHMVPYGSAWSRTVSFSPLGSNRVPFGLV